MDEPNIVQVSNNPIDDQGVRQAQQSNSMPNRRVCDCALLITECALCFLSKRSLGFRFARAPEIKLPYYIHIEALS